MIKTIGKKRGRPVGSKNKVTKTEISVEELTAIQNKFGRKLTVVVNKEWFDKVNEVSKLLGSPLK